MDKRVPKPNSKEFEALVKGTKARAIYEVLFNHKDTPLSMSEIRSLIGLESGEQEHLNRRMRELYGVFNIERTKRGNDSVYRLVSLSENPHQTAGSISIKDRAFVLRSQRCAQCGRTPSEDKIKLHVDHKIPQEWGGTDDLDNLQPLCTDCNEGKKNYYATFNKFADKIKEAIGYDEPHKRIGELLKAFGREPVPSELLEMVAHSKQYQEDWQKRMRELRELGWKYDFKRYKEGSRIRTSFILTHFEPWPDGNIRAEIRKRELRKKASS